MTTLLDVGIIGGGPAGLKRGFGFGQSAKKRSGD